MATFVKRSKYVQAKIRRKGFPPQSQTFDTMAEAKAWARMIESEMDRSIFVSRSEAQNTTLAEALGKYLHKVTPNKKGFESEGSRIKLIMRDPIAKYSLANISTNELAEFRDRRLKDVSGSTVNRDLALLHSVFEVAMIEWKVHLPKNPVSAVRRPPNNPGRERRLMPGEERKLFDALSVPEDTRDKRGRYQDGARNPWMVALVGLALETAMRRSDLLRLEWRHIDMERRTARLVVSKNGQGRTIPLSSKAVQILTRLRQTNLSGRVFPISPNAVKCAWRRAVRLAGITDLRFHDLRHEATSRLFEKGLQMIEVATITGHKDPRMLLKYTHLFAPDLAKKLG